MSTSIPIVRSTRRLDLDAAAGQTVFSFAAPLFDILDLNVARKIAPATQFASLSTGYTIALAGDLASATVTFLVAPRPTAGDPVTTIRLQGKRVAERSTDVTRAGAIRSQPLEHEFDRINLALQELRRDADEAAPDLLEAVGTAEASAQAAAASALAASGSATAAAASAASAAATVASALATIEALSWKDNVRVATTANIAINSAPATIDGVTLVAGDRILVRQQSTTQNNGIYVFTAAAAALSRAADASTGAELVNAVVAVDEGATYAGTLWRQTAIGITLGSTAIAWVRGGDVYGPASSTAGKLVRFGDTTGKQLVQDTTGVLAAELALAAPAILGRAAGGGAGAGQELTARQAARLAEGWTRIYSTTAAFTAPTDTAENTIASFTLPGGAMGPNGLFRMIWIISTTANTNDKTLKFKLGGAQLGTANLNNGAATWNLENFFANRNSQGVQISSPNAFGITYTSASGLVTAAVDTSVDQTIILTAQKATGGNLVQLEMLAAFVCYVP